MADKTFASLFGLFKKLKDQGDGSVAEIVAPGIPTDSNYKTVAASTTATMGATGAVGDYLNGVLIIPATTSPGAVSIAEVSGGSITIFTGGASSVSSLVPFFVPLGAVCTGTGWSITTGASVSAIGFGKFT